MSARGPCLRRDSLDSHLHPFLARRRAADQAKARRRDTKSLCQQFERGVIRRAVLRPGTDFHQQAAIGDLDAFLARARRDSQREPELEGLLAAVTYRNMPYPMDVPDWIEWIAGVLRTIPGPTQGWTDIVGHVAWPVTIAWLIVRFRHSIRRLLEVLIIRFKSDDLKIANVLQVTRNSKLIALDAEGGDEASDAYITERLLEFIGNDDNLEAVQSWLDNQGRRALDVVEFITESEYAALRREAYRGLIEGDKNG